MDRTLLWLLAFLLFSTIVADGSPLKLMSAPNVLRVLTPENIFVECQDCSDNSDIEVKIRVFSYPAKNRMISTTHVTLTRENHFQNFGQIMISTDDVNKDPNVNSYVYLQAQFPDQELEKIVLVSLYSRHLLIQTERSLYTPDTYVNYRVFAVQSHTEREDITHLEDDIIVIEAVSPKGDIEILNYELLRSGIYNGRFRIPEFASQGMWKLVVKLQRNPQPSFSTEFEVKDRYVMPSFAVKMTPLKSVFCLDSQEFTINIIATYMDGHKVDGFAYAMLGFVESGKKITFPGSTQTVQITGGYGVINLKMSPFTGFLLVADSMFVAVSVLTESGDDIVQAQLSGVQIVKCMYTINFKDTPQYYKPGLPFDVLLEVLHPDGTPAQDVPVVVDPGQQRANTAANGIAKLSINAAAMADRVTITAMTMNPAAPSERQSSTNMVVLPYSSKSKSYISLAVEPAEGEVGKNLRVYGSLSTQEAGQRDLTYLILSKGRLVKYGKYQMNNQIVISLTVPVTKEMLPSLRIVVYYHTNDNEVVSDSVLVHVKNSCMGMLKLEETKSTPSYGRGEAISLKVIGDPGARVGLVAVNNGDYAMNNKQRLTQKKVLEVLEGFDTGFTPGGGKDGMGVFYDAGLLFESSASGTPVRQDFGDPTLSRKKRASTVMGGEDDYIEKNERISATHFPESWLWSDITLPSCTLMSQNCDFVSAVHDVRLPDTITTWQIMAISVSGTHGICVSDPLEVLVTKEFFIELRLPYPAVRGEQLEIKAIIHNTSPNPITVRVDLLESEHVCSLAYENGTFSLEVQVGRETTRSVPFILVPVKEGDHYIEVKAAVKDSLLHDWVTKKLLVVPEGVLTRSIHIKELHLGKSETKYWNYISDGIPSRAPNTPVTTFIYVTAKPTGSKKESPLSGTSMGSLIYQPSGSAEGNIVQMASNVIATMYLDTTYQWEKVGLTERYEAIKYIKEGYMNQLAYRKTDGSFAKSSSSQSSTWLTAYVTKVFRIASSLVLLETRHICDAIKFLILTRQKSNGMFIEVGITEQTEMMGTDSDASLTAFCLIAMQESSRTCAAEVHRLVQSMAKAVNYLETRLTGLTNPYAAAITSYALANENKLNREFMSNFFSQDLSHWPVSGGHTLQATAYALLALVKAQAYEEARPIVRWFKQQQRSNGGYGSPQATMMVYQALAEYWENTEISNDGPSVQVLLPGISKVHIFNFNNDNFHATKIIKVENLFYSLPLEQESRCKKFRLSVQFLPEQTGEELEKV